MRQKILFATLVLLITVSAPNVQAQLFSAVSPSGHTLYYQWNYDDSYYSGGYTQYNSVMVVSSGAAYSASSFNGSVIIPDSVTYGNRKYAVTRINSLMAPNITNLTIPNTVNKIDSDALDLCGFSTLTIPVGVTSVGSGIAMNCPNLTTVYYNAKRATQPTGSCGCLFSWTVRNVIIGDSVEYIPRCFCTGRDSLRTVTILGNVKQIDERAFSNCKNLRSISIPSSVEQIGTEAFAGCKNLDTVYYNAMNCTTRYSLYDGPFHNTNLSLLFIGDSVGKLHLYTFDTVQTAIAKNRTPPVVDCYARDYSGYNSYSYVTNAKIFTGTGTNVIVPCGSIAAYQSQYAWSSNNISDDCVNVMGVSNNDLFGTVLGSATCSPNTPLTLYALPSAGYTFVGWTDNNYDNPRNIVSVSSDITFTAVFSPKDTLVLHDTVIVVDTLNQYFDVHDTMYIDIPYAVHDTTYIDVPVHDTTTIYDTVTLTEYVPVHDTTIQRDTVYFPVFVHDTTYVAVHDTTTLFDTVTVTEYYAVHDTMYMDVLDTLTIHDTVEVNIYVYDTLTEYVPVHDTTTVTDTIYLPVYVHDTTTVRDTTYLPVYLHDTAYVDIHDTTYINVPYAVHDTTTIVDTLTLTEYVPVHDTTYIDVHDTMYIDVPYAVHDTTYIDIYVHDTTTIIDTLTLIEYMTMHDTTYIDIHDTTYIDIHDTTYIDVPYAVHDTTYITLTDTVINTIYDTITNTVYDTVTNTVYDTIDNFVYDTLTVIDTLWLTQTDTLWLHDTIIIHDTIYITQEGVDDVEAMNAKVYSSNGQIVVDGAVGNTVWLYDINGRVLATKRDEYTPLCFDAPASGTYLIKIGDHPARKVVVIR